MKGKEIKKMVQNKLLTENEDLFFILVHGLNGIIMLSQLYCLLGGRTKANQNLIQPAFPESVTIKISINPAKSMV